MFYFYKNYLGYGQYGYGGAGYPSWNYNQGTHSPGRRNQNTRWDFQLVPFSKLYLIDFTWLDSI